MSRSLLARSSSRLFQAPLLSLVLLPSLLSSSTLASGAGIQRVLPEEVALIGGVPDIFSSGPREVKPAIELGRFHADGGFFVVHTRPRHTDALWFARDDDGLPLRDGLVRARVHLGSNPDFSILVRAQVDANDIERFSALGLSFQPRKIVLHRWTKGLVRELGVEVPGPNLEKHPEIEVAITLAGPFVVAVISDARTFEVLATLSVSDGPATSGTVGIRVAKKQSDDGGIATLSFASSDQRHPQGEETGDEVAREAVSRETQPLAGQRRFAYVPSDARTTLPAHLRRFFQKVAPTKGAAEQWVVVGAPRDLARIRREGVPLTGETADFGFKWLDPRTRATVDGTKPNTRARLPKGYVDSVVLEATLRAYAKKYPNITSLIQIGTSRRGKAIWALKISDNASVDEDEPSVLLNGGHHGLELISTTVVLDAIDQILTRHKRGDARARRWVRESQIFCVPLVNPDGADLFIHHTTFGGRKNGKPVGDNVDPQDPNQGVDLNRNYPFHWGALLEVGSRSWPAHYRYRGESAASEPEVQAMMALAHAERFAAAISYHSWATRILVPYTIPGVVNRNNDEAWVVAELMARGMPSQPSRRRFKAKRLLYPVDGTDQDWFRHEIGTLALLVEVALHNPLGVKKRATEKASRSSWAFLLERTVRGPTLKVRVQDAQGNPVVASVSVRESLAVNGEEWTTRKRDGWHHRLLSRFGTYNIVVDTGEKKFRRRIVLKRGSTTLIVNVDDER